MYKLSNRREMVIEKDGISVKQPLGTVVLPVRCWKALLDYMPDIDDLIPCLKEGLNVSYQKRLGSGWIVKVTQCYQCIVIRREEWKKEKDHRQVLLIVGTTTFYRLFWLRLRRKHVPSGLSIHILPQIRNIFPV